MAEVNDGLKNLIRGIYQKENPEKAQRLNDDVINNIVSTYNGDQRQIVKAIYDKENPEKSKRLTDDVYSNIEKEYLSSPQPITQPQTEGIIQAPGEGQELTYMQKQLRDKGLIQDEQPVQEVQQAATPQLSFNPQDNANSGFTNGKTMSELTEQPQHTQQAGELGFQGNGFDTGVISDNIGGAQISSEEPSKKLTKSDIEEAKLMLPAVDKMISEVKVPETRPLDVYEKNYGIYGGASDISDSKRNTAITTKNVLEKTKDYLTAISKGDEGAAGKFMNGLKTLDTVNLLTVGIKGMTESLDIYGAAERYKKGIASVEDKNLLMAKALLDEVQQTAQKDRSTSVGSGLADMAPWLAQFAITGGVGATVTKASLASLESMMAKGLMGKVAGNLLGRTVGAAAQTALQVPNMVQGTAERMTGRYENKDGNLVQAKQAQPLGEALGRTYANNFLETFSERAVGDGVDKLGAIGLSKIADSKLLGQTLIGDIIRFAKNNRYWKMTNETLGLNSPLTENIEEAFTGLTQPLVTERSLSEADKQIKEYFTKENLIRTFLTTAAMGTGAGVLQLPNNIISEGKYLKGKRLVSKLNPEGQQYWNDLTTAETVEGRKDAFKNLWENAIKSGANASDLKSMMYYYQDFTAKNDPVKQQVEQEEQAQTNQSTNQPVSPDSAPQFTVSPRQTKEAELRQYADQIKTKDTGTIKIVEIALPEGTDNTHAYVVATHIGLDGKAVYRTIDDNGVQGWATEKSISGEPQEIDVESFVAQNLGAYDQQEQANTLAQQNQMMYQGQLIERIGENIWQDENYNRIQLPEEEYQAWVQAKEVDPNSNPDIVTQQYGKTKVTGTKNEDGSILISQPATAQQAEALKAEVEESTGGNATVQAQLVENQDATAPQQFQLSIVPVQAQSNESAQIQPENLQSDTSVPSQDNGLKAEPTERKITPQTFGKTQIDIIEGEEFDEVVPNEKVTLEKALHILEKEFKDNENYQVVSERVQVEIPAENKYKKPTYETVIKSIKIVPKEVIARQKQADTNALLDIVDEFNSTPQNREDKQKASEIQAIAKQLGYQTERNASNQIRLFDNSGTISRPQVEQTVNNSEQQPEKVAEVQAQNTDDLVNSLFSNENSLQNNQQNEKPVENITEDAGQINQLPGEDTPQAEQGKGNEEGLEENVTQNIISADQPVGESLTADPVAEQIPDVSNESVQVRDVTGRDSGQRPAVKKPNSITGKAKEVEVSESDIQGLALQYFINGGMVKSDEILRMFKDSSSERGFRISYTSNENGQTVNQIAHDIWQALPENIQNGLAEMDVYNAVEKVIMEHISPISMAKEQLKRYSLDPNQGFTEEWLNEQIRIESEERQAEELALFNDYIELEKNGQLPTESELIELFLPENTQSNGQEINNQRSNGTDQPVNREGNGSLGQDVQGSEPGVQSEVESEKGEIKPILEVLADGKKQVQEKKPIITVIPNGNTAFDRQAQGFIKSFLDKSNVKDKVKFAKGKLNYDLFAVMDDNQEIVGFFDSPESAYQGALNSDNESFHIVRELRDGQNISYDYYTGNIFGDFDGEMYDEKGYLKKEVKQAVIDEIKKNFNIQEVEKQSTPLPEEKPSPAYGENNKIVSKERAEELRKRLRDKLNNLNAGFDPEVLAIGTELAAYHIEAGARKFADFSKAMIDDIGEAIKPYLKSIYNGARDLPGMEELEAEMTEYSEVKKANIDEILKPTEELNVKTINSQPDGKQRILQRNNKRASKPKLPSLFDGVGEQQRIGGNSGTQSDKVSGTNEQEQQPTGRKGNVLPRNADLLEPALVDFNAEDNDTKSFNPSQKYNDNIKAIETVISLINEKRKATSEEKEILSRYVGFGGLKDILLNPELTEGWGQSNTKFKPQVKRIIELSEEFDQATGVKGSLGSIKGSILNAHFTSSNVIRSVYDGISKLGFTGGRILEPSSGIGNFITFMPNQIKSNSTITAVELDDLTGNILKYLHDDVNVKVSGIQDANIPNNSQDLVISNVPFGNYKIFDKAFKGEKAQFQNRIHNYFFAKAVDMAREGGLIAFVTSKGVLDAPGNESLRRYLDQNTEFLGAVRLPDNAFKNNANTEVVTDIIFLKKNATINKNNPNFINVFKVNATHKDGEQQEVNVNQYFVDHPENMLGEIVAGGQYSREDYTVENKNEYDLSEAITKALPSGVYKTVKSDIGLQANDSQETIDAIKEGNIEFTGDRLVRKEEGQLVEIKINESEPKIKDYIKLRNSLMNLIYSEYLGKNDSELNSIRRNLNTEYDSFVKKYGKLDKSAVKIAKQDADGYNVLSLEVKGKQDGKADIFRQRTIQPIYNKLNAENVDEAIVISLYEHANINIERIAELLNLSIPEVLEKAKGKIFEQPTGGFVTRDEYLSGNVKLKLKQAQQAVSDGNLEFQNNVDELLNVIPKDIPAMSIEARLGSRWIPQEVYSDFAKFIFNTDQAKVIYQKSIDAYAHSGRLATVEATSKYGTSRRNGADILIDALLINPPKIYDTVREYGQEKRVLNPEETAKAIEKYEEIRTVFEDWVYRSEDRRKLLGGIYNERFNTSVQRTYNGDHLNISGINGVNLRKHQKDAIWMLLQNNGGIIDHLVGAGKTFVMVAGTMEMKRTGIVNKPMIIALKSTIPQIVESYRSAFPMAKVLAPLEKDFTKENRNKLFAQIANNEWDVIIMSHENYGKIPHETDIQQKFIQDEMDEVEAERAELEAAGEKQALKGLEIRLKNLEARLEKISSIDKDNSLTFEQMGIDHIMVDESQQFKNLSYVTKQRGVAGLSKAEGSKRAFNLFIGVRYLQQKYGADKGTTFLSGTPISNSMVEMYLLLKYLRPGKMNELGFNSFDSWATTFASPNSDIEFTVTGDFKSKTRFREFINVPELSMLYREIADIRTDENTPLDKPKMKGGGYSVVNIKMSEDQVEYGKALMEFARTKDGSHIGMVLSENQEKAAMLLATNLSSKMAIDMRLINPSYSYDPNGKIARLVDNVYDTFHKTNEHKGTQLIFSDLGTPKNRTNRTALLRDYMEDELGTNLDTLNEIFGNPEEPGYKYPSINVIKDRLTTVLELSDAEIETIIEEANNSVGSFNVYSEVKYRLIEKGIPEDQIVFIHDYNSQRAKEKLFKEVQQGNIRIVLGSTQKLGTGVNVQDRIVALHHLDVPWTPAAMDQRNGRGIRQGNWVAKLHLNNELPAYAYATELTLDAYKYQLLDTKSRFLNQVKSGNVEERVAREADGDSESGVGYAELVAMMSGNKDFMLKNKLEQKIDKLKRSKRNFLSEVYEASSKVEELTDKIPQVETRIKLTKQNISEITDKMQVDEHDKMIVSDINGKVLTTVKDEKGKDRPVERTDYAKEMIEIVDKKFSPAYSSANIDYDLFKIGDIQISGHKSENSLFTGLNEKRLHIKANNGQQYSVNFSLIPGIFLNNIQKAIESIPNIYDQQVKVLERSKTDLISYQELLKKGQEWEKEPELQQALTELKEVNKRLDTTPKPEVSENKEGQNTDDKIRIGDLSFVIGKESFITIAEAKNKKTENSTFAVRINEQLDNNDYTRRVKPLIDRYFGEWNSSNKVILFESFAQANNFKIAVEKDFPALNNNYKAPEGYKQQDTPVITEPLISTEPSKDRSVPLMDYLDNSKQIVEIKKTQEQEPVKESTGSKLLPVEEYRHTKTGQILYNVKINGRSDEYDKMVSISKRHNPYDKAHPYNSRYAKGFLFNTKEDAIRFKNEVEGNEIKNSIKPIEESEESTQWVIDEMESTAKVKDDVVLATVPEMVSYMESVGVIEEEIEQVRKNPNQAGIMVNDKIMLNSSMNPAQTLLTWAHEKAHRQIYRKFPKLRDRVLFLNDLFEKIGANEVNSFLPVEYKYESSQTKAQEYVTHMIEDYIVKGKLSDSVKPEIKTFIFEILNGFTTPKNIQDAKQNINLAQQKSKERNAHDGTVGRSGLQKTSGDSGIGQVADSESLRQANGGKGTNSIDKSIPLLDFLSKAKKQVEKEKNTPVELSNPSQIKSATGNNGSFDPTNNNINFKKTVPLNDFLANASKNNKKKFVKDGAKMPDSVNSDVDKNMKSAHGLRGESILDKLKRWGGKVREQARHFEHIREADYPAVYNKLRILESIPDIVKKEAYDKISTIIRPIVKTKNYYEAFERFVVLNDLMSDINKGLYDGKDLPWGYNTQDEVRQDAINMKKYVNENPEVKKVIEERNAMMRSIRDQLIKAKLLDPKAKDSEAYFHHQVLMFMESKPKNFPGLSISDARVKNIGAQKGRVGSAKAYNTNYIEAEFEVIAQTLEQLETRHILDRISDDVNIFPDIFEQAQNEGENWKNIVPEGYVKWYPKKGTNAYKAASFAEKALTNALESPENVETVLEMTAEANNSIWVIPADLAKQLDSMKVFEKENPISQVFKGLTTGWKQYILFNPYRAAKYMVNNLSGDIDIVLAYDPRVLKYVPDAVRELYANAKGSEMSADIQAALHNRVIGSGVTINEIQDINKEGVLKMIQGSDYNLIRKYFSAAMGANNFRENTLRLAAYKYFKDKVDSGKNVYGASKKKSIDAIVDKEEKAGRLAVDLLGDYGNISQAGVWMREHVFPFWSWVEVNSPRYYHLLKNTRFEDGKTLAAVGARKTGINVVKYGLKASILMALIVLWNRAFFPDEDDEISQTMNDGKLYLILGRTDEGDIRMLKVTGSLSDMLSYAGLDNVVNDVNNISKGKSNIGREAKEAGKAIVNKFTQGAMPLEKTAVESIIGKSMYPDIFQPRQIRDAGEHISRVVSMDKVYKLLTNKPMKGLSKEMQSLLLYNASPGEAAYYAVREKVYDFLDEKGIERLSGEPTKKSNTLYYYKQALKYGDEELAKDWLKKYYDLGGTEEGMRRSIDKGEVLSPIPTKFRNEFIKTLDKDDIELINISSKWYDNTYK